MPADSDSYNPTLFVADGEPYDSHKLQNGQTKQKSQRGREGRGKMAKTYIVT